MNNAIALIVFGSVCLGAIYAGVFLVTQGHPWWSLAPFIVAGSISVKTS